MLFAAVAVAAAPQTTTHQGDFRAAARKGANRPSIGIRVLTTIVIAGASANALRAWWPRSRSFGLAIQPLASRTGLRLATAVPFVDARIRKMWDASAGDHTAPPLLPLARQPEPLQLNGPKQRNHQRKHPAVCPPAPSKRRVPILERAFSGHRAWASAHLFLLSCWHLNFSTRTTNHAATCFKLNRVRLQMVVSTHCAQRHGQVAAPQSEKCSVSRLRVMDEMASRSAG